MWKKKYNFIASTVREPNAMHGSRIMKVLFLFFFTFYSNFFCRKPECPIDREDLGAQVGEHKTKKRLVTRETLPLVPKNDDDMSQT